MKAVGIRELKNRLSEYLRIVRSGESVLVTDRGTVVAEIRAPGADPTAPELPAGLVELARGGNVTIGEANEPTLYEPARMSLAGITAAELLDRERGER